MNEFVYLIEELWTDSMENHPGNAYGYKPVCVVERETEARKIVAEAGLESPNRCWALRDATPKKRYTKLPLQAASSDLRECFADTSDGEPR